MFNVVVICPYKANWGILLNIIMKITRVCVIDLLIYNNIDAVKYIRYKSIKILSLGNSL